MGTTLDRAVGESVSASLSQHLVRVQRSSLPHGLNGRGPRQDPRAAQIRKNIQKGVADPVGLLLCVLESDEADGLAMPDVTHVLTQMIAHLEARRAARGQSAATRPILTVFRTETKVEARFNLAQLKVAESPTSVQALEDALREANHYDAVLDECKDALVRDIATLRLHPETTRMHA